MRCRRRRLRSVSAWITCDGGRCWIPPSGSPRFLHALDELLDPLIDRTERVLAQHGPLSLVVQLEMDPVDGEVPPLLQGLADELAAQPRPCSLRRDGLGLEDVQVP